MTIADAPGVDKSTARRVVLGLAANWPQFALLILINAFVGGMVGIERTVVPLIGSEEFGIASTTLVVSFIVSFGVVKAFANLVSGQLADIWGRKRVLVLGWLVGLPVPFMIIWAPSWGWVIAANALLGINQGLAWSMTVIMKVDLVGPKSRGLAVGLNEFAGYLAVGVTAFLTGYLASRYGLRPAPIYLGIAYALIGSMLSVVLVRDTREHVRLETSQSTAPASTLGFWQVFALTSFRDRNLFAASQAGLVNNLNDGMSWGIFPSVLRRLRPRRRAHRHSQGGLSRDMGHSADRHRPAQRSLGPQGPDRRRHVGQAAGLFLTALTRDFHWWLAGQPAARARHRHGLSEPDRRRLRRFASDLARSLAQRLPLLARPRLRDRRAVRRHHRRPSGSGMGHRVGRCAHLLLWCHRRAGDAREARRTGRPGARSRPN